MELMAGTLYLSVHSFDSQVSVSSTVGAWCFVIWLPRVVGGPLIYMELFGSVPGMHRGVGRYGWFLLGGGTGPLSWNAFV